MLENQINYMNDFLKTVLLLREYQESSDNVKDILYNNLFTNNKDIFDKNYYIGILRSLATSDKLQYNVIGYSFVCCYMNYSGVILLCILYILVTL